MTRTRLATLKALQNTCSRVSTFEPFALKAPSVADIETPLRTLLSGVGELSALKLLIRFEIFVSSMCEGDEGLNPSSFVTCSDDVGGSITTHGAFIRYSDSLSVVLEASFESS